MCVFGRLLFSGALAVMCLGFLAADTVNAQEMPCTEEIRTFCADVQPGGGRIIRCLRQNEAKLSPVCVRRVNELQEAASGPLGACRDDWAAMCYHPRASTGRQEMIQCLQANRAKLSAGCQKALKGASGKRQQPAGMMP